MSTDTPSISQLADDSFRDYEVVKTLKEWKENKTPTFLLEACYKVLTADCTPPRMGATSLAVAIVSELPGGEDALWRRLLSEAMPPVFDRLANLLGGFYHLDFRADRMRHFEQLATKYDGSMERLLISTMLMTWKCSEMEKAQVKQFTKSVLDSVGAMKSGTSERVMFDRLTRQVA
jgi:hypothetical protein